MTKRPLTDEQFDELARRASLTKRDLARLRGSRRAAAKDLWVDATGREVELYRSTSPAGSRNSLLGSNACFKARTLWNGRPSSQLACGIEAWATRADARAFLSARGYTKVQP